MASVGRHWRPAVWLAPTLIACSSPAPDEIATDASTRPVDGALTDAVQPADARVDATTAADATIDAAPDATIDAAADATIDAAADVTTAIDAATDATTAIDATIDAATDAMTGVSACTSGVMGPAGGSLIHPLGAKIIVPVGALAAATQLSLCPESASMAGALGQAFQAGPEGQTFLKPVEVIIPFDPTRVSAGSDLGTIQLHMAPQGTTNFAALQSSIDLAAGLVHASTSHFTQFAPGQTSTPIFITSSPSLPQATTGVAYSQPFVASGGAPPYLWSVPLSSSLPPGLSLSSAGLLSGVPTVPNNFAFFVAVSDSANDAVEMAVSLTVAPANNPVPSLTQVAPSTVAQGSGDTVITLSGTGFVPTGQALWDSIPLPTTFVGPTQLTASIPSGALINAGSHHVSVSNPTPGGGASGQVTFTVTPATLNPVPSIVSVSPLQLPISSIGVQIAITGSSFIPVSSAMIGSQGIATSYLSPTQLLAAVPAAYLSTPSPLSIGVFNPAPGGGLTPTTVVLTVGTVNPTPTLATLTPSSVSPGSGAFTLSLSGSGFVQGAQAFFGSTALATTYMTNALVQAAVPAYLVATQGSAQVVLVNPTPGGGASAAAAFSIQAAVDGGAADASGTCNVACSTVAPSTAQCINSGNACLVTLASGQNDPRGIAVDSKNVYWAGYAAGTVMQISTGGGPAIPLATGQDYPMAIAVDATSVYWTNSGIAGGGAAQGAAQKVPIGGGAIVTLTTMATYSGNIAVDSTSVYFTPSPFTWSGVAVDGGGGVAKVPIGGITGGGAPMTLASTADIPWAIAVDATGVYFTTVGNFSSNIGNVMTVGLDGGSEATIASGQSDPWGIAVDSTSVYWTANTVVMSAPRGGGGSTTLASAKGATGIAIDAANVYWADNAAGNVMKVPLHGGAPVVLASGQKFPECITVDATSVYWTAQGTGATDGTVMKLTPK